MKYFIIIIIIIMIMTMIMIMIMTTITITITIIIIIIIIIITTTTITITITTTITPISKICESFPRLIIRVDGSGKLKRNILVHHCMMHRLSGKNKFDSI